MKEISRRNFLKGAVAAGVAGAAMTATGCAAKPTASSSEADAGAEYLDYEQYQKKWSFEIAPDPIPDGDIIEERTADVIVVGAGTSGLCCALSAVQSGLDVQIISRSAAPVARGGSNFAVYSKYMQEIGAPKWDAEHEMRNQLLHNSFNVDTRKWYRFYNNSEESMNWLIDEIAAENDGYHVAIEASSWGHPEDDPMRMSAGTHGWTNGEAHCSQGQPHVVEVLTKHILAEGGKIDWSTVAEQLIREEENTGRVTAVVAKNADGNYIKYIGTKAIVLATGDFSANKDMMAKYAPDGLPLFTNWEQDQDPDINKVYGGLYKGDGHRMGLWIGAAWQRTYPCPIMFSSAKQQGVSKPCVMLDETGHRFWAEQRTEGILGLVQKHCPNNTFYNIWGTNFATDFPYFYSDYGAEVAPAETTIASWEEQVEAGTAVKAGTIEELVSLLGLPNEAVAEIERYNGFCETGDDLDFHKRSEYLVGVTEAPYYGSKIDTNTVLCVLGGLRTNQYMQVCDESDTAIPGLYNIGTMVGDSYANAYTFQIPGFNLGMNCITFGYLTGKYIAENE